MLNNKNHEATNKLVALIFSPLTLDRPNQGISGWTNPISAIVNVNKPPRYPIDQANPEIRPIFEEFEISLKNESVSYTHLTLTTKD